MSRIWRLIARELRRVGNLRRFARGPRYRLRWPMSVAWGAMLIVSFAALIGLAYLVGHGAAKGDRLLASVEKTIAQPSVSVPLAFAILTSLAYACRRGRLEWLAWRPGRIQVPDFSAADLDATSQAQLTSLFRERLTRMRLASSGATPAAQPVSDFLDVLSAAQVSAGNVLGTMLGLLRAAVPGFAYELNGVVVKRGAPANDYKVSVQLVRLSSQDGSQIEVTDTDLDRAIQRAADHATAAILPRTHLCKGPWVAWRRYKMPGELFNAYEEACEHEAGKRYDQALEMYEGLEQQVKDIERPPWRRPLRRWKEQYNAACLFAIPLLRDDLSDDDRDRLAAKAVERLELATACAASSFIASRRDWVTSEDPDLNGLRSHRLYKAFEAKCFPECTRASRRPRGVQELAELRCTRDLLVAAARGLEALWRTRAAGTPTGAGGEDGHWWNEEQEAWRRIHDVCLNHDSRARLALADASRRWHRSHGIAAMGSRLWSRCSAATRSGPHRPTEIALS